jgi:hypothetical protein
MAGAGMAVWGDWLGAALIIVALASIGAYQVSRDKSRATTLTLDMTGEIERISIFETIPGLILLFLAGCGSIYAFLANLFPWFPAPFWLDVTLLFSPLTLLTIAQVVLIIQIGWWRWQRRNETVPWRLCAVPCMAFARDWIAITLAILVGVPALNAFAFTFWLGPLNLTGF